MGGNGEERHISTSVPKKRLGSISSSSTVDDDFFNLRHPAMTSCVLMDDPKPHPTHTLGDCFQYSYKCALRPLRRIKAAVRLERVFGDFYEQASDFPTRPTRSLLRQEQGGVILEYVLSWSRREEKVPDLTNKPPPGPLRV